MSEETSSIDGRPFDPSSLDKVFNLWANGVPDLIERRVEHAMGGLSRDMGKSALGLWEGGGEEVRTINEFWVVAVVARESVIVHLSLVLVGSVWRNIADIAGDTGGGGDGRLDRRIHFSF